MSDLAAEIAEYASNVCRATKLRPYKRHDLIVEIMQDAEATKQWPIAKVEEWMQAIGEACQRGLLARDSETIWIPFVEEVKKPVQKGLFDD
jgi:hypothetical protein